MKPFCDLHTHSVFSDGTHTPSAIVDEALRQGLSAVALTDHNTVDGLPDFLAAAAGKEIAAVAGAEFSVDYEGTELHVLGLFIPPAYFPQVTALMGEVQRRKEESNRALAAALSRDGMMLDYDEIAARTPNGKLNRAHIAAAMLQKGYVPSVAEAFRTYLSPEAGYYKEPQRLTVWEILDFCRAIGAVSVLAHPFLNLTEERLSAFLPQAKKHGLAGMECYYSLFDAAQTARLREIAADLGLHPAGGSDFHGENKPDILIGTGKGDLQVPTECYLKLRPSAV